MSIIILCILCTQRLKKKYYGKTLLGSEYFCSHRWTINIPPECIIYYTYINVNDRRLLFILINISFMLLFEAKYKFDFKCVFRTILRKIYKLTYFGK